MPDDLDIYLSSAEAIRQTDQAEGHFLKPKKRFDGLRVISFLGRGATSEVWRVHDESLRRDLALKIFVETENLIARERFLTEARLLAQFDHPNIVKVHSLGETDGRPYFTMQLLSPLPYRPPVRTARRIFHDVMDGLEHLHARNVIHRDLKPSNVLLNDTGRAVLTDLGIAHLDNDKLALKIQSTGARNLTLSDGSVSALGTPGFSAPEQFTTGDTSPASDIYSLGTLAMSLFDGNPPLLWRGLIRRMTCPQTGLRLKSLRETRKHLRRISFFRFLSFSAAFALAGLSVWITAQAFCPEWKELPSHCIVKSADRPDIDITLPGPGHFILSSLELTPVLSPEAERIGPQARTMPDGTVDIGYPLEILRKESSWRRRPVKIHGTGTLKCPVITAAEVHLMSGVTLVTTGRYTPDNDLLTAETPPDSATFTNAPGYTAYIVEKEAELIFTDNQNYPPSLQRHAP